VALHAIDAPGPHPLDLVRAVPRLRTDPLGFLEQCVARYGDLVVFPIPRPPVLLVADPGGVRRVLQDNPNAYSKATIQYRALSAVTGIGLLTADGEDWRRRRRIVQPAFRRAALPVMADVAGRAGRLLRERWDGSPGGVLDVETALAESMIDVVGRTLFRTELGPDGERLAHAADRALRTVVARSRSGVLPAWADPRTPRLRRAVAVLDRICADVVARRRRERAATDREFPAEDDVLALLLDAVDDGSLTPGELRDEFVTMVVAGHETVASALTWALHLLSQHQGVQDELHAELDAVFGDGRERLPGHDDLVQLPVTASVVTETLRLYPPAWVITRRAEVDDVVAGVEIPAGTLVIISPWLLHRREASWPAAATFDPGRFRAGGVDGRPRGDYLPFGVGPRLCIGRDPALVEAVVLLAGVLAGRRVLPVRTRAPRVDALITIRPVGGLPLRLERRAG